MHRLDTTNLEIKLEITASFHSLSPHPIPSHPIVNFNTISHPFIATNLNPFISGHPPFRLHRTNTFLNTLTFL